MDRTAADITIDRKMVVAALEDPVKSAKVVNLVYINNCTSGIKRVRKGKTFHYLDGDRIITNRDELDRIKKLVIPPAWENVWICKDTNGHLQVTGLDVRGRKQYRYHPRWSAIRSETKFYRMLEFGRQLPAMRKVLAVDLAEKTYSRRKVLALIVSLLERTGIRIGNTSYEKLYGSFGLTTLKNKHADVQGSTVVFTFKGKKGVQQKISLHSRKLARLIKGCQDVPGKELFEFVDTDGAIHKVDSGMVNEYIHELSGSDFTAKDFRTWEGTLLALKSLKEMGDFETEAAMKHNIIAMLDAVATGLGNTRTVCKKYYVHPLVVKLYEEKKLSPYLDKIDANDKAEPGEGLSSAEKVLLSILETR